MNPSPAETTQYLLGHFRQKVIFRTGAKPETAVEFRIHWEKPSSQRLLKESKYGDIELKILFKSINKNYHVIDHIDNKFVCHCVSQQTL